MSLTRGPFPSPQPSYPLRPSPPSQSRGCRRRLRTPCAAWIHSSPVLQSTTASHGVSIQEAATQVIEPIKVAPHRTSSPVGVEVSSQYSRASEVGQSHRIVEVGTAPRRIAGSLAESCCCERMHRHVALLAGGSRLLGTLSRRLARIQACPNSAKLIVQELSVLARSQLTSCGGDSSTLYEQLRARLS